MPRPDLLVHFQDILAGHIHHDKDSIRTLAYVCLLRMLRQLPKIWRAILPEYIAALQVVLFSIYLDIIFMELSHKL